MTAMAMSPQYAVLLLLQTEPGIDAVLNSGGPVTFSVLSKIADAVADYRGEVRYIDPDLRPPDPAVLGAARDSLAWLGESVGGPPIDDGDASVLVVERARWEQGARQAHARQTPFPDEQIVAGVINTPDEDRLLVVPTVAVRSWPTLSCCTADIERPPGHGGRCCLSRRGPERRRRRR